jgi:hypothetical protein
MTFNQDQPRSEEEYQLGHDFGIDQGELDSVSASRAFVLGVEWEHARQELSGGVCSLFVHAENVERISKMALSIGLLTSSRPLASGWREICVIARAKKR